MSTKLSDNISTLKGVAMKNFLILIPVGCFLLAGCQPANIVASKWDSAISGTNVQTRCERVDMRDNAEMETVLTKFDGWKMVYLSEFTTSNMVGTSAAVCFERATK